MLASKYHIVGGRFQPFHLGHLALLRQVSEVITGPLIVGIVNPDPQQTWPGDGEEWVRFLPQDNPLNFWERYKSIQIALAGTTLGERVEAVVPMPRPSVNLKRANQFIPPRPRTFVLVDKLGDEIERWKYEQYRRNGEQVLLLRLNSQAREIALAEGSFIRALMALNNSLWERFVPSQTIPFLKSINVHSKTASQLSPEDAERAIDSFMRAHNLSSVDLSTIGTEADSEDNAALKAVKTKFALAKVGRGEEIRLTVSRMEKTLLEEAAQGAYKLNKFRVFPSFVEIPSGDFEVCLVVETFNSLREHIF